MIVICNITTDSKVSRNQTKLLQITKALTMKGRKKVTPRTYLKEIAAHSSREYVFLPQNGILRWNFIPNFRSQGIQQLFIVSLQKFHRFVVQLTANHRCARLCRLVSPRSCTLRLTCLRAKVMHSPGRKSNKCAMVTYRKEVRIVYHMHDYGIMSRQVNHLRVQLHVPSRCEPDTRTFVLRSYVHQSKVNVKIERKLTL